MRLKFFENITVVDLIKYTLGLLTLLLINFLMVYHLLIPSFINRNPKVIITSVENMYKKQQIDAKKEVDKNVPSVVNSILEDKCLPFVGNKDAKGNNVIIDITSYECGHCKAFKPEIDKLVKKHNLKLISIPLPSSQSSFILTSIAFYLNKNHHNKLEYFEKEVAKVKRIDSQAIDKILKQLSLNPTKVVEAIQNDNEIKLCFENVNRYVQQLSIQGTPVVIINGKMEAGYMNFEQLESLYLNKK